MIHLLVLCFVDTIINLVGSLVIYCPAFKTSPIDAIQQLLYAIVKVSPMAL